MGCSAQDPFDFGGPRSCEVPDENEWVYGLMQQAYLFADDLAEIDPTTYESPHAMVADLRVDPDRWSRVSDKARTNALFEEGKFIGLGFRTKRDVDGQVVVADINAGSPASEQGMRRGDVIRMVAGFTTEEIDDQNGWSEIYGENLPGVTVALEVEQEDGSTRDFSLTKDWIAIETVPNVQVLDVGGRPVGYLMFATFVDTAPAELSAAFDTFKRAGVREVVVDLRYNGGGLISVARHFMHLLVGGVAEGRIAYEVRYNDAFSDENDERKLMRLDQSLPAVDHVVFITTGSSLSASELLINAVAAHVPTSLVGSTTGGKPVGSKHFEFCDSVAVPLTFRLLNADGKGDYYDGLRADCPATDDLGHALGDPDEASLAVALHLLGSGECLPDPAGEGATAPARDGLRTPPPEPMGGDALPTFAVLR
ncbi:MAG: PDZ domain-containing protein [Myxococcales bacterium]|nr:PDZ domain-containing protein [Myxococcales bacterium]MCB9712376.1 PDZ domain-containing protein [Myxococcales bacterium]